MPSKAKHLHVMPAHMMQVSNKSVAQHNVKFEHRKRLIAKISVMGTHLECQLCDAKPAKLPRKYLFCHHSRSHQCVCSTHLVQAVKPDPCAQWARLYTLTHLPLVWWFALHLGLGTG